MIEKLKKFLSFLLIFLIVFQWIFQFPIVPFFGGAKAGNVAYTDLVTIFVENSVWVNGGVKDAVETYAENISANLENTEAVIVPVPNDATPFKIASINEKFYFEGLGGERNLVGSVFIGDIPIPVVHDNDDFSRTIFPYVDFRDKGYIYNQISQKYEKNEKRIGDLQAEIWHGFISPNSDAYSKIDGILNYFSKNNEYYKGEGKFDPENGLMTGNVQKGLQEEYVPEVFYFDQKRESDSLSYSSYKGYLASQTNYDEDGEGNIFRNKEDIAYNRFSKPFAKYLQNQVLGKDQENVEGLLEDVVEANAGGAKAGQAEELLGAMSNLDTVDSTGISNPNVGDIQARNVIDEVSKKFVEVFAPGMTGAARSHVRNTGRYSNTGSNVQMDSIPFLVSHLDSITTTMIKSVNTKLEGEIDQLVMTGGLSRNIAVPTKLAHLNTPGAPGAFAGQVPETCGNYKEFTNFLDGTKANYLNTAADCSAYFGSSYGGGQLVEANRGLNTKHVAKSGEGGALLGSGNPTGDITEYLEFHNIPIDEGDSYKDLSKEMCATNEREFTYGYWGGKTPLNLDLSTEDIEPGERILRLRDGTDIGSSITSIRDISGGELVENIGNIDEEVALPSLENDFYVNADNKNPSPLHCLNNNYILTQTVGNHMEKLGGKIEYDKEEDVLYDPNLYFWNDEEDVPLLNGTDGFEVFDVFNTEGDLELDDQGTGEDNTANVCALTYNLPMIKPESELTGHLAFSGALGEGAVFDLEEGASFPLVPITAGSYVTNPPIGRGFDYEPTLTSETQNWTCESRNIKFDLDFSFDYVYKKIAEAIEAGDVDACEYTAMFLSGNKDIFAPIVSEEEADDEPNTEPEGEEDYDPLAKYTEIIGVEDRTFSGGYLEQTFLESIEREGSRPVAKFLTEEEVLTELVKTNYALTSQDGQMGGGAGNGGTDGQSDDNYASRLESCAQSIVNYFYKEIPSYIEHKSPESYELYTQIQDKVSPNLPIDRDRYIDFIAANNSYQKILYPYLFRIEMAGNFEIEDITIEEKLARVDEVLKKTLDEKSAQINEVIANSNPETLEDPIDIEIYNHLKVADFPEEEIDLYKILKDIEPTEIQSFLDIKEVNYYDFLVFAIYWNNLKSVPAKYKFVMEQYLSDQYQRPELEFLLPKNKKQYEIAYLGAPGTAENMYVSLDPEAKADNPFADIIYENVELGTQLFSSNVFENTGQGDFVCAPPEGVPLWEWPSALSCWLKGFKNPKISFSENSCSQKTLFLSPEEQEALNQCGGDFNKNGVEDCVEAAFPDATVEIYTDSPSYYYNKTGKVTVIVRDNDGNPLNYDSTSRVNLELVSVETVDGQVVQNEEDYVHYNFVDTRSSFGEANFYFTGKGKDVNLRFKASLTLKDSYGDLFASLESEEIGVEIRGDRFFVGSYKVSEEEKEQGFQIGKDRLVVSDATNIFVTDEFVFPAFDREEELLRRSDAAEKMLLSLSNHDTNGENTPVAYPVTVKIFQGLSEFEDDQSQEYASFSLDGPQDLAPLIAISESGIYRIQFSDAGGITSSKTIQLIPDRAEKIELDFSTNISESRGVHTPHIYTLYDKYGNIADGQFYTLLAEINGDGVTFDDLSKKKTFTTYEGFQAFKLISEDGAGESRIKFSLDQIQANEKFYVVEDLDIEVVPQFDELKVGGGKYIYEVRMSGGDTTTEKLNTNLYVSANDVYLRPTSDVFQIIDGQAQIEVQTQKSSGRNIPIEFQAYGFRDAYREMQTILHEQPIKIDISLDTQKIEASPEGKARLTVELKDRFGNVAFSDDESEVQLRLQDKVSRFFKPSDIDTPGGQHLAGGEGGSIVIDADALLKTVNEGRTIFTLTGKQEPGLAYFTVAVDSIANTSFEVNGQSPFNSEGLEVPGFIESGTMNALGSRFFDDIGNSEYRFKYFTLEDLQLSSDFQSLDPTLKSTLSGFFEFNNTMTIRGVGENAGMIETYYFWQAGKIQDKFYNSLYTTLVGADYGNIEEKNYLAGGILFDPNNRGLSVTSLLANPYKTDGVFRIGKFGSLRKVSSNEDLAQDIDPSLVLTDDSTKITLNNRAININVGDIYYNFDLSQTELGVCPIGVDIDLCVDRSEKTEIIFKESSLLYTATQEDDALKLFDASGEEIFSIDRKGIIQKDIGLAVEVDFHAREKFLQLLLSTVDGEAGVVYFNFNDDAELRFTRDSSRLAGLNRRGNSMVFHLKTNYYEARDNPETGIQVSYRDLFDSSKDLENFVEDTPFGYEQYDSEAGIGFTGTNKTLLSFASGKSVGAATKDYHSFYMINLGDPVVSLKKIQKNLPKTEEKRNFDSTLGHVLSREDGIVDYSFGDYNNDGRQDLFLQKDDGYIRLYENIEGGSQFMNRGNLLYIADISSSSDVKVGDFDGNGFSDIFMINTKGQPAVFMNELKKYTRYGGEELFSLNGKVTQAEVFDMNANGKHDIVMLDDSGQINIFFGGGTSTNPQFEKKTIEEGHGATLLEDVRSDGAAVYFDGLPQLSESDAIRENLEFQQEQLDREPEPESPIDYQDLCQQTPACMIKIDALPYTPTIEVYESMCTQTPQCIELMTQSIFDAVDISNSGERPISVQELQAEVFVELPYDTGEPGETEGEALTNAEIADLVGGNFSVLPDTHPDIQSGLDISQADLSAYINDSRADTLLYQGQENPTKDTTFILSEYAPSVGIEVEKVYSDNDGGYLKSGDSVALEVRLINISTEAKENISFVDTLPDGFIVDQSADVYTSIDGLDMKNGIGLYDYMFEGFSIAPGQELKIVIGLISPPIRVGHMEVGIFEDESGGNDGQGDVKIQSQSNICGAPETFYMSSSYEKTQQVPVCDNTYLSEELEKHLIDENNNGVPDYIDEQLEGGEAATNARNEYAEEQLTLLELDSDGDGLPDREDDSPNQNSENTSFIDGLQDLDAKAAIASEEIDTIIEGLGCGFGGGGCIANPLNWAPLAPGNDPTLFGMPVGDGLRVNEGIPVFSAMTGVPTPIIPCVPVVWPLSPLDFSAGCAGVGAGGYLGTNSVANFIRIFVTPTLTGSAGVAICFGGPAEVFGNANPPGVHPLVPGGNCIVAAMPLPMCSNDGSDGDPSYIGRPEAVADADYSIVGGNCETANTKTQKISPEVLQAYMSSGAGSASFLEKLQSLVENGEIASGEYWKQENTAPLIQGGESDPTLDLGFSVNGEDGFVFQDVQKIRMKKINPFPDFIAGWWERQIGEVADKLTDFPGIFIILPDLSGFIQGGWENFPDDLKDNFDAGKAQSIEDEALLDETVQEITIELENLGCDNPETSGLRCTLLKTRLQKLRKDNAIVGGVPEQVRTVQQTGRKYMSGIKAAYQFLGSLPLISIEPQKVLVKVPWADESTLDRALVDRRQTKLQWQRELATLGGDLGSINENLGVEANSLFASVDKNIDIIEHYARFPSELNKLLLTKELRLEQITCNIDAISEMINGWVQRNGKRFKAWVELYITMKAILKSWQLMIDIFYEYDAACHQCKNERQDLYYFAFKLISLVIPEIPVIQFPRMPDVVLDLHNIRAGITIGLPEIEIRPVPIVLPPIPRLYLPEVPSAELTLPKLPILDDYSIPELPELPSIPVVDLPDLPPPPRIPKLFSELEGMVSILKLLTKVLCILKTSPFVPEWRAGDQIAFITERTGYLPTDFIDVNYPNTSYPFVDSINVTSYVNYEFETDFIVEATKSALFPMNTFTSDVSKKINRTIPDFNLEKYNQDDYNARITDDLDLESFTNDAQFRDLIGFAVSGITNLLNYVDTNKSSEVHADYFTLLANENLNKKWIIKDPRFNELRELWQSVLDYDYEKEERFVEALQQRNTEKFDTLQSIIEREQIIHKQQKAEVEKLWETPVSYNSEIEQVSAQTSDRFSVYQAEMDVFNTETTQNLITLVSGKNTQKQELENIANSVLSSMKEGVSSHRELLAQTDETTLFAAENSSAGAAAAVGGTCEASHADDLNYKGIYILEQGKSYRLFDYLEEIDGDENYSYLDYDNDGDQDIVYMMNGVIYLKENLKNTPDAPYVGGGADKKTFSEMDEKHEAINAFREVVESGFVNITFNAHTNRDVNGYRLEFYDRIDAFDADESQNPDDYQKVTIDAFARLEELTFVDETERVIERKNIGRVTSASIEDGIEVEVDELVHISSLLTTNTLVQIGEGTRLYTGRSSGNIVYYYKSDDSKTAYTQSIAPHTNIEFKESIVIIGNGENVYTKTKLRRVYDYQDMIQLVQLPLLENTVIRLKDDGRVLSENSNINIEYYEGTKARVDFSILKKYEILDLGPEQEGYFIKTSIENAFYYSRFRAFLNDEFSTAVKTVLMSPQKQIDTTPPELDYSGFRIPVYQERTFDLTPYIYEDDGLRGIAEMYVDTDLSIDSDGNGDPRDDRDIDSQEIKLEKTLTFARLRFGPFDDLVRRQIKVIMIDTNDNVGEKILDLEVYAPIPDITYGDVSEVRGLLRENIDGEPITLFRYRGGVLSKMRDLGGAERILTQTNGDFAFDFEVTDIPDTPQEQGEGELQGGEESGTDGGGTETSGENGLSISDDQGNTTADISEETGVIDLVDPLASVEVLASNDINNPEATVMLNILKGGKLLHIQTFDILGGYNQIVPDFNAVETKGMYLQKAEETSDIYGFEKIPEDVPFGAGALIIYYLNDPKKEPLFTIHKNGKIFVKDDTYTLSYVSGEEYIVLSLYDENKDLEVGRVLVNPGTGFVLN